MTEPIVKRGIKITGENPMIVLYREGTEDDVVALVSMWTATYSPAGIGRALLIWVDPEYSGLGADAPVGIYTDNAALADYVWQNFYRDYERIRGRGIETDPPIPALFTETSGGDRFHRITCAAGPTMIELEWRDVLDCKQVITYPPGFECSVVVCPCAHGEIRVNGVAARGEVHQPEEWAGSSAALAFAETWREI
jgi:hypothetical protein